MKYYKSLLTSLCLILGLNLTPNLLLSEEADEGIEEVIVTARRTEESLQEVPVAVTAFSAEGIEARQIINTSDIQLNVPNVSFTNTNFGGNSFSIRGIGRLVTAGSGEAGVSAHLNDIPVVGNLITGEYYDMERIEVLRGPQGTLYGRNATGGVVNFITEARAFVIAKSKIDVSICPLFTIPTMPFQSSMSASYAPNFLSSTYIQLTEKFSLDCSMAKN